MSRTPPTGRTSEDVTLFGAWGPIEHGIQQLADTFRWVAGRFGPEGEAVQDIREIHQSGDLAITVGFERGRRRSTEDRRVEMVIRVTHAFRREPDGWRLVHRHADFPPSDPRRSNTATPGRAGNIFGSLISGGPGTMRGGVSNSGDCHVDTVR